MSENFYILLDLDSAEDDWSVIQEAIRIKRREFNAQMTEGPDNEKGKRYLGLVPAMEKALRDPQQRREVARDAKRVRDQVRNQQLADLEELVANGIHEPTFLRKNVRQLLAKVGRGLSKSERARGLGEGDVVACLQAQGIAVVSEAETEFKPTTLPKLDPSRARQLKKDLQHIGKKSLYDFLGMDAKSTTKYLRDEAHRVYQEIRNNRNTVDAEVKQTLAGACINCFSDEPARQRYDNTRHAERMEEFNALIEVAGFDKLLDRQEIVQIVRAAEKRNISQEFSLNYIAEFCEKKGWTINPGALAAVKEESQGAQRTAVAFRLSGRDFDTAENLGRALAADWQDGLDTWNGRQADLYHWIKDELGLKTVAHQLKELADKSGLDADAQVLLLIHALDPDGPLTYKGLELTPGNIQALADRFRKDTNTAEMLRNIYDGQILSLARTLLGNASLAGIDTAWRSVVDQYETICQRLSDNMPRFDKHQLTILLAAATPGSSEIKSLRALAQKAATRDATACRWFRDLGDLAKAGPAVLLAIPILAPIAISETLERRKRRRANFIPGFAGAVFGAVITFLGVAVAAFILDGLFAISENPPTGLDEITAFITAMAVLAGAVHGARAGIKNPSVARPGGLALVAIIPVAFIAWSDGFFEGINSEFVVVDSTSATSIDQVSGNPVQRSTVFNQGQRDFAYFMRYRGAVPNKTKISIHLAQIRPVVSKRSLKSCTVISTRESGWVGCQLAEKLLPPGSYIWIVYYEMPFRSRQEHRTEFSISIAPDPIVLGIQSELKRLGFDVGSIDGIYGVKTKRAIQSFQRKHSLKIDGEVSERILSILKKT